MHPHLQPPYARLPETTSTPSTWSAGGPADPAAHLRRLTACMLLAGQVGATEHVPPIAALLARAYGDARTVQVLLAVGALLGGDPSVAKTGLAADRVAGAADVGALVFAVGDRVAGDSDGWREPVDRVLSTSADPTLRALAYAIAALR